MDAWTDISQVIWERGGFVLVRHGRWQEGSFSMKVLMAFRHWGLLNSAGMTVKHTIKKPFWLLGFPWNCCCLQKQLSPWVSRWNFISRINKVSKRWEAYLFLEKTAAHQYLIIWWMGYGGGCWVFNSPNGVCHNPAGGVLGSDQRIQFAAFEGIKETTPAG